MRSLSATARYSWPVSVIRRSQARLAPARRGVVVPMALLPRCGLIPCCFAGFDQRAALVEIQDACVMHDVLVVFPELEAQLPRRLLDCGARACEEMPVAAREMSGLAILAPSWRIVTFGVVADHQKFRAAAAPVEFALHLLQPAHGRRADPVTGGVSHGQHDGVPLQSPQIKRLTPIVAPAAGQPGDRKSVV